VSSSPQLEPAESEVSANAIGVLPSTEILYSFLPLVKPIHWLSQEKNGE
jgi:hypothetical protein